MQCERARDLLSPYVDGELSADELRVLAAHLETCNACTAQAQDVRRVARIIGQLGREPVPATLANDVRKLLAQESREQERIPARGQGRAPVLAGRLSHLQMAAAMAAAAFVGACIAWWAATAAGQRGGLEHDLLSAHLRSLLQDTQIQVASSDTHKVKPWFQGRVEFAPEVRDLRENGFELLGGRLDYVGSRRVGVLVYKRRLHVINVFVWSGGGEASPRSIERNGYNLIAWTHNAVTYWAVSDLSVGELQLLQQLL